MKEKDIKVISLKNPLTLHRVEKCYPEKTRLSDILKESIRERFMPNTMVVISDRKMRFKPYYVKPEDYNSLIIKGDTTVTLRARPTGGDDGKDIFRIILSIAVMAVAIAFGPALGTAIMGSASTTATMIGTGVINLFGSLALNALIPPQTPQFSQRGMSVRESPTLSITGAQNRLNHYGVVPRLFGTHKMYPVMAATPYTEIAGNDQYLRLLFDFGYGELELSDLKIGNIALSEFEEVETEIRYGTGSDDPITLYSNIISQDNFSIKLTHDGGAQVITTEPNTNWAVVDSAFDGLVSISDDGTYQTATVQIKYEYRLVGGGGWTLHDTIDYSSNTAQAYYCTESIEFPTADDYEIQMTRITEDYTSNLIRAEYYIKSLKSVTDSSPINVTGRCMIAMRIKATDQLNGMVDQFNAIATAKLSAWNGSAWATAAATRNPAWAFAEVLRGAANSNPVADSLINGNDLLTWANACDAVAQDDIAKWRFDGIVDYGTTVFELLRDIAAAGRASFAIVDGEYTVIRDVEQSTPIQHFTPRNSWGFSATKVFIDAIHGVKCRFTNPDRDWQQDEVIAYADGYDIDNATEFQVLELWGCTSQNQAWREGRYQLAVAQLRPEIYKLQCDIENLVCTRGDMVRVTHDVTGWGERGARITVVTLSGGDATHITLDDAVTMEAATDYNVRIRADDGDSTLHDIVLDVGTVTEIEFTTPIPAGSLPLVGDLIMFGEQDLESVELIVHKIEARSDLSAMITLLDASPAIHTSDTGTIPAFDPKVTAIPPVQKSTPDTPVILEMYSDEYALYTDADGVKQPQIIIDISPAPLGTSVPRRFVHIRHRETGQNAPWKVEVFPADETRFFLQGVKEGVLYDVGLRAESLYGEVSAWAGVGSYNVVGRTNPPSTPTGFTINIIGSEAYMTWTPNTESDLSYYIMRFTPLTTGATYADSIDIANPIPKSINSLTLPARTGTYYLKAVDTLGKKSIEATEITTIFDSVKNINVVETVTESPTFAGAKTDCLVNDEGLLILGSSVLWDDLEGDMDDWLGLMDGGWGEEGGCVSPTGTYEFDSVVDLGSVYTSRVTASITQRGFDYANTFDSLQGNCDSWEGLWDDLNGSDAFDVNVSLFVALTDDDPAGSPSWSAWQNFFVGEYKARGLKFKAILTSDNVTQSPQISALAVEVDMPDRIDGNDDITSDVGGTAITFSPAFKALKKVGITAQNLQQGDYYTITSKSTTGFTVTFYNSASAAVARIFDWDALGYGHLVT